MNRHFIEGGIQMANKHMKGAQHQESEKQMEIMRCYCTLTRMANLKNQMLAEIWSKCSSQTSLVRIQNGIAHGVVWQFLIKLHIHLPYDPAITILYFLHRNENMSTSRLVQEYLSQPYS